MYIHTYIHTYIIIYIYIYICLSASHQTATVADDEAALVEAPKALPATSYSANWGD